MSAPVYLGIFEGHFDPAVAAVRDGEVLAYAEEERFTRQKHAQRIYPMEAVKFCLEQAGVGPEQVAAIGVNWNCEAYGNGEIAGFFAAMERDWPLDDRTKAWQRSMLANFNRPAMETRHGRPWQHAFGDIVLPPLHPMAHHYVHALHAYLQSPFDQALCLTVDGSGDQHCTVLWSCQGDRIEPIRELLMPHSLGWFYAAVTEYLGFEAYDGEYKVMGLAAYGKHDDDLHDKIRRVLAPADDGIEYRLDPTFIHYGARTWSERFTDALPALFGRPRRLAQEPIEPWHHDLAFAAQQALEAAVERLVRWGLGAVGTGNLCIGGGVGLNVKMNTRLFELPSVERIFAQPLCADGGAAAGAALGACWEATGARPEPLRTLALGNEQSDEEIEAALKLCGLTYERPPDIAQATAEALAKGQVVGWFQGRMEAGPRALGQRSILADPRREDARDRVNEVIKYREFWRPFCPSMQAEAAERYLVDYDDGRFMIVAFKATEALKRDAPAVVHVDGTARVQLVQRDVLPLYHDLIRAFAELTGVPVLLNTSFNVKGEPIVSTINDAIRTFYSTGMDVLATGSFLIRKEGSPKGDQT
jgi:carbamoyltransferase